MKVDLSADTSDVVSSLVASGAFQTPGEAVAEGIRLLEARETLRQQVQAGIDQLDAGQGIAAELVYERARRRIAEIAEEQNTKS